MCVDILKWLTLRPTRVNTVLSTDQEVIPARNARGFVLNDELLLAMLKELAQYTLLLNAT
jgi:hypothetical protein